jgi:hypothetical protein
MSRLFRESSGSVGNKGFLFVLFYLLFYVLGYLIGIVVVFMGLRNEIGEMVMEEEEDISEEEMVRIMNEQGPNN